MLSVPLHASDAERRLYRQILQKRDRADIREVFPGEQAAALFQEAGVRDALEYAFAVLVTCPRIPQRKRGWQVRERAVRLINDDGRAVRPIRERRANRGRKRDTPVHGLFD